MDVVAEWHRVERLTQDIDERLRTSDTAVRCPAQLPARLSVDEVESYAHSAMRDSTIDLLATAYREGRIDDATLAQACDQTDIGLAEVRERLG